MVQATKDLDAKCRRAALDGLAGQENTPRERIPAETKSPPAEKPPADQGDTRTATGSNCGDWVPERR
jgi:hypothetical protein